MTRILMLALFSNPCMSMKVWFTSGFLGNLEINEWIPKGWWRRASVGSHSGPRPNIPALTLNTLCLTSWAGLKENPWLALADNSEPSWALSQLQPGSLSRLPPPPSLQGWSAIGKTEGRREWWSIKGREGPKREADGWNSFHGWWCQILV